MTATSPPAGPPAVDPLPCGHDGLAVVDRARADESTEHEQLCPHCQERIDEDRVSGAARAALAADERDRDAPPDLLPNVMRTVWSDLRRPRLVPLAAPGGPAFVAQHVVVAVVEDVLAAHVALQVRSCTLDVVPAGATQALAVRIRAVAAHDVDLLDLARRARALVVQTVDAQFGWLAGPVDIDIVDLYLSEDADDGR